MQAVGSPSIEACFGPGAEEATLEKLVSVAVQIVDEEVDVVNQAVI